MVYERMTGMELFINWHGTAQHHHTFRNCSKNDFFLQTYKNVSISIGFFFVLVAI